MAAPDFNYKVALASGLKSLQAGQLRKAEEQFRYLREKFPHADGGYRGTAKVASEQGDRPAALAALREGAAALARAGERAGAIGLLREILALEPADHAAHRRLAAALVLASDRAGAIGEQERYARLLAAEGPAGLARAQSELRYAREQLGDDEALAEIERRLAISAAPAATALASPSRGADAAMDAANRPEPRDALELARAHLAAGRTSAAADLLMAAIGAGSGVHEAERLLAEAASRAGLHEVARERLLLLARLALIDGRTDIAAELDRSAQSA